MPRDLALVICVLFIMWLFVRDQKWRPMTSWSLWIPLLWILIVGSRPISSWSGGGMQEMTAGDYTEGSPLDRNILLLLIFVGLIVLLRRRINWGRVFATNLWVCVFLLYCCISAIWSDYPFVSFKRWVKDIGNVVMVMIIISEDDPVKATKAVFGRYIYLAIPLSVLFIKYFPELGRYYNYWTGEVSFSGVTIEKNTLGCVLLVCNLFLVWDFIEMQTAGRKTDIADFSARVLLIVMEFWLIGVARSSTALVCIIVGTGILILLRPPLSKRRAIHIGAYSLAAGLFIIFIYCVPGIFEAIAELIGRDVTLTGRSDIWANLLKEPVDPILGKGYQDFWIPTMRERYNLNQAHNGYLETYLNGGLVGFFLLIAMIISAGSTLKKELLIGNSYGSLRFSILIANVLMNWTEAAFGGLSFAWVTLLIAILNYPHSPSSMAKNTVNGRSRNGLK
jgi:exopolysaccharide production protein ExoQ